MTKITLHDTYVKALQMEGCSIVPNARSGRYTVLTRPKHPGTFYYVGSNGAVRFGRTVATSAPCSDGRKQRLVESLVLKLQQIVASQESSDASTS